MAKYGLIKDTTLTAIADGFREKGIIPANKSALVDFVKYASPNATSLDDPTPTNGNSCYLDVSIPEATSLEYVFHVGYYSDFGVNAGSLEVRTATGSSTIYSTIVGPSTGATITKKISSNSNRIMLSSYGNANTAFAVTFEVYPLDADGNRMQIYREQEGVINTITPEEMAEAISNIPPVLPNEAVDISGSCMYRFSYDNWSWFINNYGDLITTKDLTDLSYAFSNSSKIERLPFILNVKNAAGLSYAFRAAKGLKECPKIRGTLSMSTSLNLAYILSECNLLRDAEDLFTPEMVQDISSVKVTSAYSCPQCSNMLQNCLSLRRVPSWYYKLRLNPESTAFPTYNYSPYYYSFYNCYVLDEVTDLQVWRCQAQQTNNLFNYTFNECIRLKKVTFETDNGQPFTVKWKNQTIDLSYAGYNASARSRCLDYNSGITADKEVKDDATYQALKTDPDWFTTIVSYSRYNHDSAVETINSLPDTSATGTNIIKFKKAAGSKTDGGAIENLTAEEIAVAAAKGWTVTLV